jgi:hypothetical protein
MPNEQSLAALAQLQLVQTVDDDRATGDVFKLPAWLRGQVDADFTALDAADNATALTESDRAGTSGAARDALTKLQEFLRDGYRHIDAIRTSAITDAQRLVVFTAYGWVGGMLGRFGDARVIGLTRLGVKAKPGLQPAWLYPADLIADLTAQLAIFDTNASSALGADRIEATRIRNAKLDLAETTLAQVRFFYCSASRDTDQTPELAAIGFQPRRDAGEAGHSATKPAVTPPPTPSI